MANQTPEWNPAFTNTYKNRETAEYACLYYKRHGFKVALSSDGLTVACFLKVE